MRRKWEQSRVWVSVCVVLGLVLQSGVLWAAPQDPAVVKQRLEPASGSFPTAAWTLEGVSAVVAAAGMIVAGVGVSFLATRDQRVRQAEDATRELEDVPSAREVRELEDKGMTMVNVGWIAAGVGLAGMLVGAIWLLAHKRTTPPLPPIGGDAAGQAGQAPVTSSASTLMVLD